MPNLTPADIDAKLLFRGIHLELSDAMKASVHDKVGRLLRHEPRILRVRIDVEHDKSRAVKDTFVAKGLIEISGPDLVASESSDDAYKSIDALIDKLDGLLRKRHSALKEKRHHPHAVDLDAPLPKAT